MMTAAPTSPMPCMGRMNKSALTHTGQALETPRSMWPGYRAAPEGPHVSAGDYWYLLIAEGGTERGQ